MSKEQRQRYRALVKRQKIICLIACHRNDQNKTKRNTYFFKRRMTNIVKNCVKSSKKNENHPESLLKQLN